MFFDVVITLFINLMLLLSMSFIQQLIPNYKRKYVKGIIVGFYSGIVGLVLMSVPFEFYPGMIFDTRSVLISSTAVFFGGIPAFITWLFLISYRLYIGGSGVLAAFINISQAALIGLFFRRLKIRNDKMIVLSKKDFVILAYSVHIIMFLIVFTLPVEERNAIMPHLWYMVLILLPIFSIGINIFHKYQINLNTRKENIVQYRDLFEKSHVVLMMLDPIDGRIIDVNKTAIEFYGYSLDEITKMTIHDINTLPKEKVKENIELCLDNRKTHFNVKHKRKDGSLVDVEVHSGPIMTEDREIILSTVIDASDKIKNLELQQEREKYLEHLSYHDHLTGLYNRGFFETELKRVSTKRQMPLSVVFADVDDLKDVNDQENHLEGDKLLKDIARILKEAVRDEDIVARWGGDEFVILLPQTNEHIAKEVMMRIKRGCKKSKNKVTPSLSLGHFTQLKPHEDINYGLKKAEEKMYINKRTTKNGKKK